MEAPAPGRVELSMDVQKVSPKYATKQQRMIAIFEAYRKVSGKKLVTTTEVAEWAVSRHLYPAPRRGDSTKACLEWEARLEVATKE